MIDQPPVQRMETLAPSGTVSSVLKVRIIGEVLKPMGLPMALISGGQWSRPIHVLAEAVFRLEGW